MDVTKQWLGSTEIELWSEYHGALDTERELRTVYCDLVAELLDGMCGRAEVDAALTALNVAESERRAAWAAYAQEAGDAEKV